MNKQRLSQLIVFPLLLVAAFAAIIAFGVITSGFAQDYLARSPAIVYDRRLWAMLGIGLALFGIVTWGVSESMLKGGLGPKISRWVNRLIVGGIILMITLLLSSVLVAHGPIWTATSLAYPQP